MSSNAPDLSGFSLLAVFAHPDDESFACGGVLAWCAARGARVVLLCATRGEEGRGYDDPAITQDSQRRARCGRAHSWDFGSPAPRHPDGELAELDYSPRRGELEADILHAIELVRPDVVITFGEDGLYWHPDHIAVHRKTTTVIAALQESAPALYYVTLPHGTMRAIVDAVELQAPDGHAHRDLFGIDDPDAFGVLAAPPTLIVDVGEFAAKKVIALRCHESQLRDGALAAIAEAEAARLLRIEQFTRAPIASTREPFLERLRQAHPS